MWRTERRCSGAVWEVRRRQSAVRGSQELGVVRGAIWGILLHNPAVALLHDPSRSRSPASGSNVSTHPFRPSPADLCRSGGNKARRLVGPRNYVDGFCTHTNCIGYTNKDPPYDTNTPEGGKEVNNEPHIKKKKAT